MPLVTVHNQDLSITQMVLNRLTFVLAIDNNYAIISSFIWEVCNQYETCLKVSIVTDPETGEITIDLARIGDEQYYSVLQRSLIADIVCIYMLEKISLQISSGLDDNGLPINASTFLSKAKAGSVEVEYTQFDTKKGGSSLSTTVSEALKGFRQSAFQKGIQAGCLLDVCNECMERYNELAGQTTPSPPFIVFNCFP